MKNSSRRCITSHLESCRLNGKGKTLHTHPVDRTNVKPAKGHSQLKSALLHLLMMLLAQHTPLCVLCTCFQCYSAPRHLSLTSKPRELGSLPHDVHFSLPICLINIRWDTMCLISLDICFFPFLSLTYFNKSAGFSASLLGRHLAKQKAT